MLIKSKLTKKLLTAAACSFVLFINAVDPCGQTITWEKIYGHQIGSDELNAIIQTEDEGYLVAGRNIFGLITMRLNKYGDTLWTRIYPGSIATDIKKTNDGNFVVLGQFSNVTKINIDGDILWTVGPINSDAGTYDIEQLPNGHFILSGSIDTLGILFKPHIILINSSGVLLSQKTFSSGFFDGSFRDLTIVDNNEYILCGRYSDVDTLTQELFIMKLNSKFDIIFFYGYDSIRRCTPHLIVKKNSNFIIGGHQDTGPFLTKIDEMGSIHWFKKYMNNVVNSTRNVTSTFNGGFALTGWWDTVGNSFQYVFLIKTDSSGNEEWRRVYGSNANYRGNALQQTSDSGYVIAGIKQSDMYIVKTDKNGFLKPIGLEPVAINSPTEFKLRQNFPNPFNPVTKISFDIVNKNSQNVKLSILNVLGQLVVELVDENLKTGSYEVEFNAKGLPSGVYYYRIFTNGFVDTKKMILLK